MPNDECFCNSQLLCYLRTWASNNIIMSICNRKGEKGVTSGKPADFLSHSFRHLGETSLLFIFIDPFCLWFTALWLLLLLWLRVSSFAFKTLGAQKAHCNHVPSHKDFPLLTACLILASGFFIGYHFPNPWLLIFLKRIYIRNQGNWRYSHTVLSLSEIGEAVFTAIQQSRY